MKDELNTKEEKPTYIMGIDTATEDRAYCLSRAYNGNFEVIFAKTTTDDILFQMEVDSLCNIFNASLVQEVASGTDRKSRSHKKYPLMPHESFSPEETIKAALYKISTLQKQNEAMLQAIREHKVVSPDSAFFELKLPEDIKKLL